MPCTAEDVDRIYVISRSKTVLIFPQGPSKLRSKHAILNYKVPAATVIHHTIGGQGKPLLPATPATNQLISVLKPRLVASGVLGLPCMSK